MWPFIHKNKKALPLVKKEDSKPKKIISTNFDTHNHEVSEIVSPVLLRGIKCEINKIISPWLQVSAIKTSKSESNALQIFTTAMLPHSFLQLSFDTDRNYQAKYAVGKGAFLSKIHSIVSSDGSVYTRLESMYSSALHTACVKLVKPIFEASNLVYILSFWRAFGSIHYGFEAVTMNRQVGITVATRVEGDNGVFSASLQRFNTLTLSIYRRFTESLSAGVEGSISKEQSKLAVGLKVSTCRSDVKLTVNNDMNLGFAWEERLSEMLTVSFNGIYGGGSYDYGISMLYG